MLFKCIVMKDLYCKSFVFKTTQYEAWCDNKCLFKGNINLKIVAIPANGYIVFRTFGKLNFDFEYGFGIKMDPVIQKAEFLQYGAIPQNKQVKKSAIPKECKLYNNRTCIQFDFISPFRTVIFYGSYDETEKICSIEQIANELFWLYKEDLYLTKLVILGVQWLNTIKKNPIELLNVHNPQVVTHALLSILTTKKITNLDILELIADIGYWAISKAIEIEPNNIYLYSDRLSFMIIVFEGMKWSAMKSLNLARSFYGFDGAFSGMPEIKSRDAVYKMMIADMYNHPETYMKSKVLMQHKIELDEKIKNKFFYPQLDIKDIIETGNIFHQQMYSDLSRRIQENDFDKDFGEISIG